LSRRRDRDRPHAAGYQADGKSVGPFRGAWNRERGPEDRFTTGGVGSDRCDRRDPPWRVRLEKRLPPAERRFQIGPSISNGGDRTVHGWNRVEAELGRDCEGAAAAASHGPAQVLVESVAGVDDGAVGENGSQVDETIAGQAELARRPAPSPSERDARDADAGACSGRNAEAVIAVECPIDRAQRGARSHGRQTGRLVQRSLVQPP
jgi:hypothetical protein